MPDQAAFHIDFAEWLKTLSSRDRKMVELLAAGERPSVVARKFKVSPALISLKRKEWRERWAH